MKYLDEGFRNFKWVMELFLEWLLNNFFSIAIFIVQFYALHSSALMCCEGFPNRQNHQIDKIFNDSLGLILSMENKSQAIRHSKIIGFHVVKCLVIFAPNLSVSKTIVMQLPVCSFSCPLHYLD